MAGSGFQHLTLDERRSLFRMQEARLGVTEMAARLGRHRSTIHRELGRRHQGRMAHALASAPPMNWALAAVIAATSRS